jgi:hypothetical protein
MTSCSPEIQASGFNQKKSKKRKLLPNWQAKQSNQNKNNNNNLNTYLQENFGACLSAQVKRWERVYDNTRWIARRDEEDLFPMRLMMRYDRLVAFCAELQNCREETTHGRGPGSWEGVSQGCQTALSRLEKTGRGSRYWPTYLRTCQPT